MKNTFALFALFGSATALCPNACSGHGSCGRFDRCSCYAGFQGGDCSGKTCAYTIAWSDTNGHDYAECGNRGTCNRETGLCECYDGYEGKGCDRMSCPDSCSDHGTCETMVEVNSGYLGWDATKIMTCKCDPGYSGPDCSERMCIRGDDPMSVTDSAGSDQSFQVSTITIGHSSDVTSGDFTILVTDWRGQQWETWPIVLGAGGTSTATEVKEALEALPNHAIPEVEVAMTTNTAQSRVWAISFTSPVNSGAVTIAIDVSSCSSQGCQPVRAGVTADTMTTTTSTPATTESYVCSNRGSCDSEKGLCSCFEGYTGEACELQTIIM